MNRKALISLLFGTVSLAAVPSYDVVVVGAGIGGLTTAWEASGRGLSVGIVDMASIFGGHAVMSSGGLSIVGTPTQREVGIEDSPDLAYQDFLRLGEDANEEFVRVYVDRSRELIYDWLTRLGVKFRGVSSGGGFNSGNTVNRFHMNPRLGFGLVAPIYRECLKRGVGFHWNSEVTELIWEQGKVGGVRGRNLRSGETLEVRGQAVVVATGGYESNLKIVRENWPKHLGAPPERVLLGSGVNSMGSGFDLVRPVGGSVERLDHQWIYSRGIPDPFHSEQGRGLYITIPGAIWVNIRGERFTNESGPTKETIRAVTAQPGGSYWMIFDSAGAHNVFVVGPDWQDEARKRKWIVENEELVKRADSLEQLARATGMPAAALAASVAQWNQALAAGKDAKFGRTTRFPARPSASAAPGRPLAPTPIATPPFYAARIYPLTRKSMGGIVVDLKGRVLTASRSTVPGLYAVGEATGLGFINGKAALEGTFLGPSIVQGRLTGEELASVLTPVHKAPPAPATAARSNSPGVNVDCRGCHQIEKLVTERRPGYWHFEKLHSVVLERNYECGRCHAEMAPFRAGQHRVNRIAQIENCLNCHLSPE
jgi:predicted oxidoreductase